MDTMKSSLPESHQRLLELMQQVNYGRLEALVVRDGLPVFNPPPRARCEIRLRGENGPRPEFAAADFAIKSEVLELIAHLKRVGDGVIDVIEVQRGLPFRMTVEVLV